MKNNFTDMDTISENSAIAGIINGKKLNGQDSGNSHKKVELGSYGFRLAGKNHGDLNSLRNSLYTIYNRYLGELTGKQNQKTRNIQGQIDTVNRKITGVNNQVEHIETQEIPQQQKETEIFQNDIERIRIEAEAGFVDSDFNWVKTILFTLFSSLLGLSLVFFYTSLVYNGLFKNLGVALQASEAANSTSLFNSLLDIKSLFTFNTGIVLSYLFSSLFLTMGLLLHTKPTVHTLAARVWNRIGKGLLLMVALAAEVIFAYKIEKNIDIIKSITLPDYVATHSIKGVLFSVDVLIVIVMGFVAYLIWSSALEATFNEWNKRNPRKLAVVKIRELEKKIRRRRYNISELRNKLSLLRGQLNELNQNLETLKNDLNQVFFEPVELEERLEAFFGGWLRYVNNHEDLKPTVKQHQEAFLTVKRAMLGNVPQNLLSNN